MKLNLMLEVEETVREIEERTKRNRLGMLVTEEVAKYRAEGAKKDVEALLGAVNAVLDKLALGGDSVPTADVLEAIREAMKEKGKTND